MKIAEHTTILFGFLVKTVWNLLFIVCLQTYYLKDEEINVYFLSFSSSFFFLSMNDTDSSSSR